MRALHEHTHASVSGGVSVRSNGHDEAGTNGQSMALLALSHTPTEHQLYLAMLAETQMFQARVRSFSVRHLMKLTGLNSLSKVRRARAGLVDKLSIERLQLNGNGDSERTGAVYLVFTPEEIFERRRAANRAPYPLELSASSVPAIERVVDGYGLSRREAQVALCCAEGLTNAEIGERLFICKQTVKFHLRNVFMKYGVKRRTELISRLLRQRASR